MYKSFNFNAISINFNMLHLTRGFLCFVVLYEFMALEIANIFNSKYSNVFDIKFSITWIIQTLRFFIK